MQTMSKAARFMFDDAFDDVDSDRPSTGKNSTISEQDLQDAREQAFAEGRATGAAEARAEIEAASAKTLDAIATCLTSLGAAQVAANEASYRDSVALARLVAGRLAPALIADQPLTEIEGLIGECLEYLGDEPRIVVRVVESLIDNLTPRIDGLADRFGFPGKIILLPDERLAVGDCRVEWADGGAERIIENLTGAVDAAVARYIATRQTEIDGRAPAPASSPDDISVPPEPARS
jgi:flagellar assembly protein FliH